MEKKDLAPYVARGIFTFMLLFGVSTIGVTIYLLSLYEPWDAFKVFPFGAFGVVALIIFFPRWLRRNYWGYTLSLSNITTSPTEFTGFILSNRTRKFVKGGYRWSFVDPVAPTRIAISLSRRPPMTLEYPTIRGFYHPANGITLVSRSGPLCVRDIDEAIIVCGRTTHDIKEMPLGEIISSMALNIRNLERNLREERSHTGRWLKCLTEAESRIERLVERQCRTGQGLEGIALRTLEVIEHLLETYPMNCQSIPALITIVEEYVLPPIDTYYGDNPPTNNLFLRPRLIEAKKKWKALSAESATHPPGT